MPKQMVHAYIEQGDSSSSSQFSMKTHTGEEKTNGAYIEQGDSSSSSQLKTHTGEKTQMMHIYRGGFFIIITDATDAGGTTTTSRRKDRFSAFDLQNDQSRNKWCILRGDFHRHKHQRQNTSFQILCGHRGEGLNVF